MVQRCLSCGAENPATNRFCGQCGILLERAHEAAANTTRDGGSFNAIDGSPANSGADQPLNKYRFVVVENANPARTGFLGLSDDGTPGYDEEERRPPSHLWRNIAVSVAAVALLLTALQWRSIRDYNLRRYSLVSVPDASKRTNPSGAVPADGANRTPGLPPAAAKTDAPQVMEGSSADRAHPVQQTGNSLESAPPAANSSPSSGNPLAGSGSPHAMGAPIAESQSPDVSSQPAKFRNGHPAGSLSSTALPGATEMNRAAHAIGAEARAAWLWKAVGKGNPQASVELASMYVHGSGVVRNCDQARILLRVAAQKGNEEAKFSLQQIRLRGGCGSR